MIRQHTHQYLQWRKALPSRLDLENRLFWKRAVNDRGQLSEAQNDLAEQVHDIGPRLQSPPKTAGTATILGVVSPAMVARYAWDHRPVSGETRELVAAATTNNSVPTSVQQFFDDYLHDSRAGFRVRNKMEFHDLTGGYLRYRNIYQNTREQTVAAVSSSDAAGSVEDAARSALSGTDEEATA
ncbi:hypothetical protein F4827_000261 [Paraburkholderia bannensis]|uniref:Uncharacterized protein n=1 Tax=Paraburkholderia bannensis TaxID=765414 RepID=A0A7W9TS35_9BURK|nr:MULTISPECIES: hypothetical protein [Paraburkholderia]MBB3255532.1 hypothetical protein [Paraburkholderia sp. WP4_3_2]MBB6100457.1 hypothetical protein [Paraburkholderia bannensis]